MSFLDIDDDVRRKLASDEALHGILEDLGCDHLADLLPKSRVTDREIEDDDLSVGEEVVDFFRHVAGPSRRVIFDCIGEDTMAGDKCPCTATLYDHIK